MANTLSFTCPNCGNHDIEEVRTTRQNVLIEEVSDKRGILYRPACDVGYQISHYRCSNCFRCLNRLNGAPIDSPEKLIRYLDQVEYCSQ